jgi:hypothetical protein
MRATLVLLASAIGCAFATDVTVQLTASVAPLDMDAFVDKYHNEATRPE